MLSQNQVLFCTGAARQAIAATIMNAGMRPGLDLNQQPCMVLFTGTLGQYIAALNALCRVPWVRPVPGQLADVGDLFCITRSGKLLEFLNSVPPFHG